MSSVISFDTMALCVCYLISHAFEVRGQLLSESRPSQVWSPTLSMPVPEFSWWEGAEGSSTYWTTGE